MASRVKGMVTKRVVETTMMITTNPDTMDTIASIHIDIALTLFNATCFLVTDDSAVKMEVQN